MNIFFDCDFTLTGIHGGLRPFVKEVFQQLREDGHQVFIWSGVRVPWDIYRNFGLDEYINGVYLKPLEDHHEQLVTYNIPVVPDFVIDDNVDPVEAFGGYVVPPYIYVDEPDDFLWRAYEVIKGKTAGEVHPHMSRPQARTAETPSL